MTSADWPPVDVNPVSLPTIVSTSDLFDGELFGDELIDIYDSSVGDVNNEIPHLLPSDHSSEDKHQSIEDSNHPGVHVAAIAAAMDDGLGAFRPSTSFNDLTTLLSPVSNVNTNLPAPVTETTDSPTQKGSKKRSSSVSSNGPAAKRKTTPSRGSRRPSVTTISKKQTTPVTKNSTPIPTLSDPAIKTIHVVVNSNGIENIPNPVTIEKITSESVQTAAKIVEKSAVVLHESNVTEAAASLESDASCNGASEADFRSIAQAAVSNLIMTASTSTKSEAVPTTTASSSKIDTSTAHIKALTGNNWVSACSGATVGVSSNNSDCNDNKSNNRARRQNLTPDERARQNRDRNREHARNTRLRKKAYVEELKRTLTELVAQRDAADSEKRQAAQREQEQREVRFRVLEEFLKLRGRNERNAARWAAILEEGFSLTAPVTPYRNSPHRVGALDQVLRGVTDVMEDSNCFSQFLQQLGGKHDSSAPVVFQFNCDRSHFYMDDCVAILEWNASSIGAVAKGATNELSLKGVLRGKFSPASNKLVSANVTFDSSPILLHLQKLGKLSYSNSSSLSTDAEAAAAEVAACEANAILDSLEMPRLSSPVPTAVTVVHPSSESSESSSKGEMDSDESVGFGTDHFKKDITTRRVTRSSSLSLPE